MAKTRGKPKGSKQSAKVNRNVAIPRADIERNRGADDDPSLQPLQDMPFARALREYSASHSDGDGVGDTRNDECTRVLEARFEVIIDAVEARARSGTVDPSPNCTKKFKLTTLRQTLGEVYTGGRSTPVYALSFQHVTASDGDESLVDEQGMVGGCETGEHRIIAKLILQNIGKGTNAVDATSHVCDIRNPRFIDYAMRVRSYDVEANFYGRGFASGKPCPARAASRAGLTIPTLLAIETGGAHADGLAAIPKTSTATGTNNGGQGSKSPSNKTFAGVCFIMRDLQTTHPVHPDVLSIPQAKCALAWLAKFHARFWEAPKLTNEWPGQLLWEEGTFWAVQYRLKQQYFPNTYANDFESAWNRTLRWMAAQRKLPEAVHLCSRESIRLFGLRLKRAIPVIFEELHPAQSASSIYNNLSPVVYNAAAAAAAAKGKRKDKCDSTHDFRRPRSHVTLVHGDFKAANIFFMPGVDGDDVCNDSDSCAVCDLQFTGPGLGVCDVAYLLFPDPRVSYLDVEHELLCWYYDKLQSQWIAMDKGCDLGETYPRALMEWHYRLAQMEFLGYMFTKGWVASSANDVELLQRLDELLCKLDGGELLGSSNEYAQALATALVSFR